MVDRVKGLEEAVCGAPAATEAVLCIMQPLLHVHAEAAEEEHHIDLGIYVKDSDASGVHAHAAATPLVDGMHARVLSLRGGLA